MTIQFKLYEVGGHVRDALLGVKSNDIDYTVVIENKDDYEDENDAFDAFHSYLSDHSDYEVFLATKETLTIRAKQHSANEVRDFVLARKETGYREGTRRPLSVGLGTLEDDLRRRDFTVNCIARDPETGEIFDPFNGQSDLEDRVLTCPISSEASLNDDPLRAIRAIRFCVTKGFYMSIGLSTAIKLMPMERFKETVSKERVYEEFKKMFDHDTIAAFEMLIYLRDTLSPELFDYIFTTNGMGLTLTPSLKS